MYSRHLLDLMNALLLEGRLKFTMHTGVVSRIKNYNYEIVAISSQANVFVPGQTFELNDTYCRDVYESAKTIAFTKHDNCQGLQKHPLYKSLPIESYISSPIIVDNKVWGTINYSSMTLRDSPFSEEEFQFNEEAASTISKEIFGFDNEG